VGAPDGPRVIRRSLPWEMEPSAALRLLRTDAHPVALFGAWADGSDIVASEPLAVRHPPHPLADVLGGWPAGPDQLADAQGPSEGDPGAFGGGWIGYLGFGLAEQLLPSPPAPGGPRRLPAWWFGYYDHVLRRHRASGRWSFEAIWTPDRASALRRRFEDLLERHSTGGHPARPYVCGDFRLEPSEDEHRSAVARTVEYIRRGDLFQANICLRLEAAFEGDPLDAFCRAASELRPPYAAFVGLTPGAVASLSPELFLRRAGGRVISRPIKGTTRRSGDVTDSARQRHRLLGSEKDRAEHLMIVDLIRNDLSRVSTPGSVVVPGLLRAEQHPGVWHLVSDVQGELADGVGDDQLVAATFPPGSVTGAPKVRSVEVIHELESVPREAYTGAIGYRSQLAGLELNVAIRTFEFDRDRVWLGSGGGITARSDPGEEFQECLVKADPLIAALGAAVDRSPGPGPGRGGIPAPFRPRPAAGVFTSLRVVDGWARHLDRHLARLEASTSTLYGKSLPGTVGDQVAECVAAHPTGRLRITAQPVGGPLRVTVEVVPLGPHAGPPTLRPVTVAGGLGDHKWRDRRLLGLLAGGADPAGPDEHLLIVDDDGEVLETDRASLFAVVDGVLLTPPADGRILPGVTRTAVVDIARTNGMDAVEGPLSLDLLMAADEVLVANSVVGLTAVGSITGPPGAWPAGPVGAELARLVASLPVRPVRGGTRPEHPPRRLPDGRCVPSGGRPDVVLIDNYDSFTYNLAHLLLAEGCRVEVVRNDEVPASAVAATGAAGIVISPGPCGPAEAGISVEVVRECGSTMPLLGICLGHQAIAAAYGARVVGAPEPVHGSASVVTHDGRGVLAGLPHRLLAGRYHSLVVDGGTVPDGLEVTAHTDEGLVMGLRHTLHPVEGVQFHPESILTEHGAAIIGTFVHGLRSRIGPASGPWSRAAG
jgi:para-aminobenzoate synthetase/4-amino-4-deoxychorismate lyase